MFTVARGCLSVRASSAAVRAMALLSLGFLIQDPAWSQRGLPGCAFNLCATGVELGNAKGLARWADPRSAAMCSEIYAHVQQAERHLPQANRTCAQNPSPPWPAFQDWRTIGGQWERFWSQYGRGRPWCPGGTTQSMIVWDRPLAYHDGMNDSQLYYELGAWSGNLVSSLSFTAVDRRPGAAPVQTDFNMTCGSTYLAVGALLGHAQATLQLKPTTASHAFADAMDKYNFAMQSFHNIQLAGRERGITKCGDFRPVLQRIDAIFRAGAPIGANASSVATDIRQTYLRQCEAASPEGVKDQGRGWMRRIRSGDSFQVVLDQRREPIGSLAGGGTYSVVYRNGAFICTGFNLYTHAVGTWTYSNANLDASQITLWGAVFTFNEAGEVFYFNALAGHLR